MRKKTFSLILSGILPITALSFTAFANGGDTAGRPVTPPSATDVIGQIGSSATEAYTPRLISGMITATIYQTVLIWQERAGIA